VIPLNVEILCSECFRTGLPANARSAIRDNRESRENVTDLSERHSPKQYSQMTSTERGIAIDVKPLQPNTVFSSLGNLHSLENVTDPRDAHFAKQPSPMTSTEAGIAIDLNPLSKKASLSSRDNFDSRENVTDVSEAHS
jgi:hypothetical protein